jgi:hypothetical protein
MARQRSSHVQHAPHVLKPRLYARFGSVRIVYHHRRHHRLVRFVNLREVRHPRSQRRQGGRLLMRLGEGEIHPEGPSGCMGERLRRLQRAQVGRADNGINVIIAGNKRRRLTSLLVATGG